MIQLVLEKPTNRLSQITNIQKESTDVRVNHFTENGYSYLYECFEVYCNNKHSIKLNFPLWQHEPDDSIFTALVEEGTNASYTEKVLFYAQTEYLRIVPKFDEESFQNWMRVIRNILSRGDVGKAGNRPTIIRSPETFDGVINLIHELSNGCSDIYGFLAQNSIKSSFAKEQIEEEQLKAHLIMKNNSYKEILFQIEDTNFCQGRIKFILYCIDFNNIQDNFDVKTLEKLKIIINDYLEKDITNDLRRGLLTINGKDGESFYHYWWSWSQAVNANKRCLIAKYRELEYYIYGTKEHFKDYLKKLLLELTKKDLKQYISDFIPPSNMPNWKIRLIKEANLLDAKCKSHYIAIPKDESCCYLLRGIRPRDKESCEEIK